MGVLKFVGYEPDGPVEVETDNKWAPSTALLITTERKRTPAKRKNTEKKQRLKQKRELRARNDKTPVWTSKICLDGVTAVIMESKTV